MICPKPRLPAVLVIVSQILIGKALCEVLARSAEFDVLGDSATVPDAPDERLAPDILLLDIDGVSGDVGDAIRACRRAYPESHVCTLTAHAKEEVMQRCLGAGAEGYVVKDATPAEFIRAVRSVGAGVPYVDPRVAAGLLRRRTLANWRNDPDELSQREIEIICLIANGLSNRDISDRLTLSEKTVKNYISRIFSKLHITARTQAAAYAFRSGMV